MTDTPENPDSGAAGTEFQTAAALRTLGHEVDTVWAGELPRRLTHGNLHYLLELPLTYRARMLERISDTPYDVVHVSQPHGYLAARSAKHSKAKPIFVHRSHGLEGRASAALAPWQGLGLDRSVSRRIASRAMASLLEFNNRGIARHADGHLVSATLCGEYLRTRYGVPASRIAVIPQAAPALYLETPAPAYDPARLDRILHVGQFAFFKAPMILANSIETILCHRPHATLTWVCSAAHHAQARAQLGPLGRERTTFLNWVPQRQLMPIFDRHGIFLFPSFFEGFGKVFLEAMSRGLAVVASDEGGARDLIVDGRNGRLVPVGDSAAMAQACLAIQSCAAEARAMCEQARKTGLRHTWRRVAAETAQFYVRLMDQRW